MQNSSVAWASISSSMVDEDLLDRADILAEFLLGVLILVVPRYLRK